MNCTWTLLQQVVMIQRSVQLRFPPEDSSCGKGAAKGPPHSKIEEKSLKMVQKDLIGMAKTLQCATQSDTEGEL